MYTIGVKSFRQTSVSQVIGFLHLFGTGAVWGLAALSVAKVSAFLLKLLIARIGVPEFGAYYLITSVFTNTTTLTAFGLPMALTRFIALYRSKKEPAGIPELFQSALTVAWISAGITSAVFFLFPEMFIRAGIPAADLEFFRVVAAGFIGMQTVLLTRAVLFGLLNAKAAYLLDMMEHLGKLVFTAFAVVMFGGLVRNALWGYITGIYLTAVAGYMVTRTKFPWKFGLARVAARLLSYTWPVSVSEIITSASSMLFLFALQADSGAEAVGQYAAAVTVSSMLFILPQITLPLFLPYVTSLNESGEAVRRAQNKMTLALGIPTAILLSGILILGRPVISFLFGARYAGALGVLRILAVSYAWYAVVVWSNRQILDAYGYTRRNLVFTITRTCTAALVLLLASRVTAEVLAAAIGLGWIAEGTLCLAAVGKVLKRQ